MNKLIADKLATTNLSQNIKNELTKLGYIHIPCTHNKTGNKYWIESVCINCTNANDGQLMISYFKAEDISSNQLNTLRFVRDIEEFFQKFSLIK